MYAKAVPTLAGIVFVIACAVAIALRTPPALACGPAVEVAYTEAAPIDFFAIENRSVNGWILIALTIDLDESRGRLIFDTAPDGAGFNVWGPFQALSDPAVLITSPDVADGDTMITLGFQGLAGGQVFQFGIDMDDRLTDSIMGPTIIDGAEIEGANVRALLATPEGDTVPGEGRFNRNGRAILNTGLCV